MVFLFFISVFIIFICILTFSKIRIEIINFKFTSMSEKHLNEDYKIIIKLRIFSKFTIIKIILTEKKLKRLNLQQEAKIIKTRIIENKSKIDKKIFKVMKKIKINIKKINLDNDFKNLSFIFTIHLVSLILIRVFSIYIFGFESYENNFMIQVLLNIAFIIYEMYMVSKLMSKLKNNITIKKRSSRIKKSPISGRVIDIEQYKNMNK